MNDALHEALSTILLGVASGVGIWIAAYFRKLTNNLAEKAAAEAAKTGHEELAMVALAAVKWAAQTLGDSLNEEKKQEVVDYVKKRLPWVDEDDLEKAIEAAVFQLNAGL